MRLDERNPRNGYRRQGSMGILGIASSIPISPWFSTFLSFSVMDLQPSGFASLFGRRGSDITMEAWMRWQRVKSKSMTGKGITYSKNKIVISLFLAVERIWPKIPRSFSGSILFVVFIWELVGKRMIGRAKSRPGLLLGAWKAAWFSYRHFERAVSYLSFRWFTRTITGPNFETLSDSFHHLSTLRLTVFLESGVPGWALLPQKSYSSNRKAAKELIGAVLFVSSFTEAILVKLAYVPHRERTWKDNVFAKLLDGWASSPFQAQCGCSL